MACDAVEEIELPVCGAQRFLGLLAPGNIAAYDLDRRLSLVHGSGCDYLHVNSCPVNTMEPLFDQGDRCTGISSIIPIRSLTIPKNAGSTKSRVALPMISSGLFAFTSLAAASFAKTTCPSW